MRRRRTYLKIHNVINEGFEADVRQAGKISDALSKVGVPVAQE